MAARFESFRPRQLRYSEDAEHIEQLAGRLGNKENLTPHGSPVRRPCIRSLSHDDTLRPQCRLRLMQAWGPRPSARTRSLSWSLDPSSLPAPTRKIGYCFSGTVSGLPLSATMTASTLAGSVRL